MASDRTTRTAGSTEASLAALWMTAGVAAPEIVLAGATGVAPVTTEEGAALARLAPGVAVTALGDVTGHTLETVAPFGAALAAAGPGARLLGPRIIWNNRITLALALGLIAGLLDFIPYVGPWLGAAPAVLLALAEGPAEAVWTAILFLVIQQVEGNVLMPVIQKRASALPPVLTILAVVAFGVLFGFMGVFLATPLLLAQQKPEPDRPAHFVVPEDPDADFIRRVVEIPMRDGVKLYTVVVIPKAVMQGKAPIMLTRTPYNAAGRAGRMKSPHITSILGDGDDAFIENGYIRVFQDVRGKYGSEGDYVVTRPVIDSGRRAIEIALNDARVAVGIDIDATAAHLVITTADHTILADEHTRLVPVVLEDGSNAEAAASYEQAVTLDPQDSASAAAHFLRQARAQLR